MTEWFMVPVLKTGECKKLREFESHSFRQIKIYVIINRIKEVAP